MNGKQTYNIYTTIPTLIKKYMDLILPHTHGAGDME
jgi:hypothetical protein